MNLTLGCPAASSDGGAFEAGEIGEMKLVGPNLPEEPFVLQQCYIINVASLYVKWGSFGGLSGLGVWMSPTCHLNRVKAPRAQRNNVEYVRNSSFITVLRRYPKMPIATKNDARPNFLVILADGKLLESHLEFHKTHAVVRSTLRVWPVQEPMAHIY
jgi:hypothetical protein